MLRTSLASVASLFVISVLFGAPSNEQAAPVGSDTDSSSVVASQSAAADVEPVGHPTFVSPHAKPIVITGGYVFVTNTPADTVDVIDAAGRTLVARVPVGVDPVGIAARPDGREVWVANHISDSVSVIDTNPESPTWLQVVATIQDFDPDTRATRFDEPVGIAFADNEKAYVALSSENQIAVVDVANRTVTKRLDITAQDPRAIVVRGNRLYVIPFESNNQTQLSGGAADEIDGDLVTFDAWNHSVTNNNVLSIGHVVDIVKHPDVPDRDLYVFDTRTDELVEVVDTLGTLLYGLTVDSDGRVFIAQTDARNDANGRAGTKQHSLDQLENRPFLNRITSVSFNDDAADTPQFIDLEPLPPEQPPEGNALATPFAIQISEDDSTLVVSAAGSDKLFTVDAVTGDVLGRVDVDAVPRGIALENDEQGSPAQAWVLNAVANTVSLVDLTDTASPQVVETLTLADPTHPAVKRGRMAFETASASTTGTFSCSSCHPDGHTDQLLWVLKTPVVTGGDQIMPRSTMPVRGLRDTEPYHWDGIPGDPYGGNNSANVHGSDPPNSQVDDSASSTRHLIDGGLASTMHLTGDQAINDEGKAGRLSAAERDDMATFLLSVPYPPAQRRSYDNVVSSRAREGFELFHIKGHLDGKPQPNVCGDCHRMPFLVSTNTPGTGMDAPTWRGAYDRFLILPQGRLNIIGFDFYRRVAEEGIPERNVWQFSWQGQSRFDPVWDMVLEQSTGYSGAFARQVTLNQSTSNDDVTNDLLDALERSDREGGVVLQGEGVLIDARSATVLNLRFDAHRDGGTYVARNAGKRSFTRDELQGLAAEGRLVGTFTGRHGPHADVDHPQPALWTLGPIHEQRGRQEFPTLTPDQTAMTVSGRHIRDDAGIYVDGRRVPGAVSVGEDEQVTIELQAVPDEGTHLLQVQNPGGLFSNDFIFHVAMEQPVAEESDEHRTLGQTLRATGWDRLLGTWGDEGTGGDAFKATYEWKFRDRLLHYNGTERNKQSFAMIGVDVQKDVIFHVGADSDGSSSLGQWRFEKDGDAVLGLAYTSGDGTSGTISVRMNLEDDDTLVITLELPQPITIRMKRAESE
ncbi:Lactonase, 7-bladed beta-propeller [Maioricimonas rarisocia]|uniref:Lactonase, 7-bladed beta-propeller n=1 Tax=Maioricimonas rarisocia TaxID=2528026 RepID=A0A517Z843_9PLAN|nr:beta-propeller fold lactonase family protein [Maioricimonas rarisocia]QDU38636.1 Lactonase, 7-bladed beta-propeller [Maioricimonas rarisocia]